MKMLYYPKQTAEHDVQSEKKALKRPHDDDDNLI